MWRLGFLGGTRRLQLSAKHSGLEPYTINLKLIQPAFLDPETHLSVSPFWRREKELAYTIDRVGGNIALQHHFAKFTNGTFDYTLEQDRLNIAPDVLTQISDFSLINLYNKSSCSLRLVRDSGKPLFYPVQGSYGSLTITYSGIGFNSQYHFFRFISEYRRYHQLPYQWSLAARVKGGSIISTGTDSFIPIEERFFAGGISSVRGWARSRLGPLTPEDKPTGGNSYVEMGLEVRHVIYKKLAFSLFFETGNVWSESFTFHAGSLRYSAGAGLRFDTPNGPIRLDIARPVFDVEKKIQFYVSVGHAY
jgi:outer membrane protein insertion porin family